MKDLRRALGRPSQEILGRAPFGQMVGRSALSIKHYEMGATPIPVEVLERCREIAVAKGWKDLADRFSDEITGKKDVVSATLDLDGKILALAEEIRELREDLKPLISQAKRR